MKTKWTQILQVLQENLPEADYSVWIQPLTGELQEMESKPVLLIHASNEFVASYIRSHYLDKFRSACRSVLFLSQDAPIDVQVASKQSSSNKDLKNIDIIDLAKKLPSAPAVLATNEQHVLPMSIPAPKGMEFKYSFNDFIVGPSNRLAHAAAESMLLENAPTEMCFLSSQSGLGKTHLIQAVGHHAFKKSGVSQLKMAYLSAEDFTTQFINASKFKQMDAFKTRFRSLDILLLEDIHFLHGKDKTQEELLATIKALHKHGSKVILTSSFNPKEIVGIDSHLLSYFQAGFVASIEKPDKETRLHILIEKARKQSISLPEKVAELMAQHLNADVRMLESCVQNLILRSKLNQQAITEDMAYEIIGKVSGQHPQLDTESIVRVVCKSYSLNMQQLQSSSRRAELVTARNTAFYLLRKHTDMTLAQIGASFNRKHSTVTKGISQIEREMSRQSHLGRQLMHNIEQIERICAASSF